MLTKPPNKLIFLSLALMLWGCVKWNLERFEIANFQKQYTFEQDEGIGFKIKNDLIQTQESNYLIAGRASNGSLMTALVSDTGDIINQRRLEFEGEAHKIIFSNVEEEDFFTIRNKRY